ncbi:MAG: hypothetical protein O2966_05415 [Proteobacteria bacterium]|nr:hypothetical protein [Pseudomonadota bacterium]
MNNNDNKKSAKLWTHQLFKQTCTSKTAPNSKTYFAHRYHENDAGLAKIPFSAFFLMVANFRIITKLMRLIHSRLASMTFRHRKAI